MKKANIILTITLVLIAAIALVIVFQWRSSIETPSIEIPIPSEDVTPNGTETSGNPNTVTPQNVQALIELIERPDSFSRGYTITRYYEETESQEKVTVYQKNGQYRFIHTRDQQVRNTLLLDGTVYYWYDGLYGIAATKLESGDILALDRYGGLIIYEELLELNPEQITLAAYELVHGENCIVVEYESRESTLCRLSISIDKGLLISAEISEDGVPVYSMTPDFTEITPPTDDFFAPPSN